MLPLLPAVGLAALGLAILTFGRREMNRITRKLDDRDEANGTLPDKNAPMLRRDPQSGQWRPDPERNA
ncbi:hypothetical protein GCM10007276_11230 [Agaricicola taiwanensis]|uniref:Uncharacterized protein n=1 Tax=Agaricicola taiwanensis TaxID=591372 RepID=A0A8J2YGI9_9RHOB|nr:hypothetical protein [Agaricicola taiwanensis]GGE35517.1 hypothetical protein GCM10007276_11230 [Agaricicola taiwanensis]